MKSLVSERKPEMIFQSHYRFLYWLEGYLEILLELSHSSDYEAHPDLRKIMDKLQKEIERVEDGDANHHVVQYSSRFYSDFSGHEITEVGLHDNSFVGKYPECHDPLQRFQPIKIKDAES